MLQLLDKIIFFYYFSNSDSDGSDEEDGGPPENFTFLSVVKCLNTWLEIEARKMSLSESTKNSSFGRFANALIPSSVIYISLSATKETMNLNGAMQIKL